MAINLQIAVYGQSTDSLLNLLNNDQVKDDVDKYNLLCDIANTVPDAARKITYSEQAIKLAEKLDILPSDATIFKGIGYLNSGNPAAALECFMKAAEFYIADHSNHDLARAYLYMAESFNQLGNPDNEMYYLKNAIDIFRNEKDSINLARTFVNLGYANLGMGQYYTALNIFSSTSEIFQKLGYITDYAYCLGNSGLAYSGLSDFDKAEDYLLRAIEILTKQGDERAVTEFMIEHAYILQNNGEIKEAIACAAKALGTAVKNGFKEYEGNAAYTLANLYKSYGKYDSAFHYLSLYINANDSIKSDENIRKMADLRTEFEVARKQAEVNDLQKKKLFQRIVILGLVIILLLAIGLIVMYYYSMKRSKILTSALDERNLLLEKQSKELLEQNDKITKVNEELRQLNKITISQKDEIISSINYAQKIQSAILPPEVYITELLNENFIFYKPKDIVSGDFYWIKQVKHYVILVCADCTGHGVPGAFMSMLGISYLNEIVQRREITQANQILNELRKQIKHSLRQSGDKEEPKDGINIALCVIDSRSNIMQYAGAYNPLYIISTVGGEPVLKEIKADSMPVGVHIMSDKSFTNHEIQFEIGDTFYIFSDGFVDQVGGSKNIRFNSHKFKKLLLEIHDQPMYEQKEMLDQTLKDWMGMNSQRDDILVIGARVS